MSALNLSQVKKEIFTAEQLISIYKIEVASGIVNGEEAVEKEKAIADLEQRLKDLEKRKAKLEARK
ncbi:hypothetical protein D3C71_2126410 [compost metagenome]